LISSEGTVSRKTKQKKYSIKYNDYFTARTSILFKKKERKEEKKKPRRFVARECKCQ
jgi:hypothetical protein